MERTYDLQSGRLRFRNRRNLIVVVLFTLALIGIVWQQTVIIRQRTIINMLLTSVDSASVMNAPLQAQVKAMENDQQAARSREITRQDAAASLKADFRGNWKSYVSTTAAYGHGNFFGGIDDVKVSVRNESNFIVDEVAVTLSYIRQNGEVHKQEVVSIYNLAPNSTRTVEGPESGRGTSLTSSISGILCRDASLLEGTVSSRSSNPTP